MGGQLCRLRKRGARTCKFFNIPCSFNSPRNVGVESRASDDSRQSNFPYRRMPLHTDAFTDQKRRGSIRSSDYALDSRSWPGAWWLLPLLPREIRSACVLSLPASVSTQPNSKWSQIHSGPVVIGVNVKPESEYEHARPITNDTAGVLVERGFLPRSNPPGRQPVGARLHGQPTHDKGEQNYEPPTLY